MDHEEEVERAVGKKAGFGQNPSTLIIPKEASTSHFQKAKE